jgi:hypothetical protein
MWTYDYSAESTARPDRIFDLFRDVTTWPHWNPAVEWMELDGPFAAGTTGTMKVPGQDPLRMRLVWVEDDLGFEDETEIPGAGVVVRVRHALKDVGEGLTRITYEVTIDALISRAEAVTSLR